MPSDDLAVMKTYVPANQKERWQEHAAELDMNQSEFLRSMVQAGRRGFELEPPEARVPDVTPGVDGLEDRLLAVLDSEEFTEFDELVDVLTAELESRIDETLQMLVAADRVRHSNVEGGYALVGSDDGDD